MKESQFVDAVFDVISSSLRMLLPCGFVRAFFVLIVPCGMFGVIGDVFMNFPSLACYVEAQWAPGGTLGICLWP